MAATDSTHPIVKVLFALYPGVDALDVLGPLEVLKKAQNDESGVSSKAFETTFVASTEEVETSQAGTTFTADISYADAQKRLSTFDILIVPGAAEGIFPLMKTNAQPIPLIKAFCDIQLKDPTKERTLLGVATASLLLGHIGTLAGLCATTHPDYVVKFENVCSQAAQRDLAARTDVLEERYVVNNLRFDMEDPEQTSFIRHKSDSGRRPSNARKGSMSWKESNTRRESNARRASLRLGGLRLITTGATSCGVDAALYLVSIHVSVEAAEAVARQLQHSWTKGVVVDGIDV